MKAALMWYFIATAIWTAMIAWPFFVTITVPTLVVSIALWLAGLGAFVMAVRAEEARKRPKTLDEFFVQNGHEPIGGTIGAIPLNPKNRKVVDND